MGVRHKKYIQVKIKPLLSVKIWITKANQIKKLERADKARKTDKLTRKSKRRTNKHQIKKIMIYLEMFPSLKKLMKLTNVRISSRSKNGEQKVEDKEHKLL